MNVTACRPALRRSGFTLLDNGINARIIGDSRFRYKKKMFTRRDMRRRVAIKIHRRMWMPERRWHVYRLLKKLLDGRAGSKSAGTYLRHFTEALCRAEITIAIVIIGCVMRTMRLGWTRKSHPIVCRASRFDRKRQSGWKNIHTSPRNSDRKNMAGRREEDREEPPRYRIQRSNFVK